MEENGVTIPLPLARGELAALAGIIPHKFDELFECVNVLDKWPGKQGKGDAFPLEMARPKALSMRSKLLKHRRVVLLGKRVEMAFGLSRPWFQWAPQPWEQRGCDGAHRGAGFVMDIDKPDGTTITESCPTELHHHHDARCPNTYIATCPHPSGVNRWWNDARNRRAAAVFWGALAQEKVTT